MAAREPALLAESPRNAGVKTMASKKELARRRAQVGKNERSRHAKWESHAIAWSTVQAEPEGKRVIFDRIEIADDGGLSEIGNKPELWSNMRYLSALIALIFVVYNVQFVILNDIGVLSKSDNGSTTPAPGGGEQFYLLGTTIIEFIIQRQLPFSQAKITVAIELALLAVSFLRILWRIANAIYCCHSTEFTRWSAVDKLFWDHIPDLSYFSAMQLLNYITPAVLSQEIFFVLFYTTELRTPKLIWILVSRPICLIIGLDAFLIKYRSAREGIVSDELTFEHFMDAVVFLNQVLGVVQLRWAVKKRLFRFVFGGEDGVMTERETIRMDIWNAMVAQHIFKRYRCDKALAIMLTWSDDDFQMLVLNEEETLEDHPADAEDLQLTASGRNLSFQDVLQGVQDVLTPHNA